MNIAQAAAALEVSPSTVRRLLARGELRYLRVSQRCIRIDQAAIDAYKQRARGEPLRPSVKTRHAPAVTLSSLSTAGAAFIAAARAAQQSRKARRKQPGAAERRVGATELVAARRP
ncbi:MAG: helix-turn-helix domain-containing protein [Casimicrobiaceae bacterium]